MSRREDRALPGPGSRAAARTVIALHTFRPSTNQNQIVMRRSPNFWRQLAAPLLIALASCDQADESASLLAGTAPDTAAIADTLRALVERAYDFSRPGVVERLMSLYPERGPVVSAAAGRVTTTRDSLRSQIEWFWNFVGQNMQDPHWEWTVTHVRVLGPDAAVLTATYQVPHRTPEGRPHVVEGAWTMVFQRQDDGWRIVHEHLSDVPPNAQQSPPPISTAPPP